LARPLYLKAKTTLPISTRDFDSYKGVRALLKQPIGNILKCSSYGIHMTILKVIVVV